MYQIYLKRICHIAHTTDSPQLEHSLCGCYIGDAEHKGDFQPSEFENLCLDCLRAYLRRENLAMVGIVTTERRNDVCKICANRNPKSSTNIHKPHTRHIA